jgi:hypothetical protein
MRTKIRPKKPKPSRSGQQAPQAFQVVAKATKQTTHSARVRIPALGGTAADVDADADDSPVDLLPA